MCVLFLKRQGEDPDRNETGTKRVMSSQHIVGRSPSWCSTNAKWFPYSFCFLLLVVHAPLSDWIRLLFIYRPQAELHFFVLGSKFCGAEKQQRNLFSIKQQCSRPQIIWTRDNLNFDVIWTVCSYFLTVSYFSLFYTTFLVGNVFEGSLRLFLDLLYM